MTASTYTTVMFDFEAAFTEYFPKLMTYARSFTGFSDYDREDAVQDVFVKIYNNKNGFNSKWSLSTWIYRIARNSFIDRQRKNAKARDVRSDSAGIIADKSVDHDTRMDVESAVSGLKPEDRELVYLYYSEDFKIREIAQLLETPEGTVKNRLYRIREKLKNKLEDAYVSK